AMLGQGRGVAVVLERDRAAEPLRQRLRGGRVLKRAPPRAGYPGRRLAGSPREPQSPRGGPVRDRVPRRVHPIPDHPPHGGPIAWVAPSWGATSVGGRGRWSAPRDG